MTTLLTASDELGHLLSTAYVQRGATAIVPPELEPPAADDAYRAQRAFLNRINARIGGWKVGAKSPEGPIQGAPLPLKGLHPTSAMLRRDQFGVLGIELEIMFALGRDFLPSDAAPTEREVIAGIAHIGTSMEIVSSRLAGWPEVPKLNQLADLQNHGALITGDLVAYDEGFNFRRPHTHLTFKGDDIFKGAGANPAGDPRRLLHWVVRHCQEQDIALPAGTVITAGSYTGMFFPKEMGMFIGQIEDLPPIELEII
ncbi:MAG: 2-keto-4-pentenoate hydratase [Herbaspirillum frisingense]|uniref:2-keto-4-pentenoate hydratase n=1 Tax=Herbaspirillum frisingense TaxID=92645 RepID=A0A7V8JU83_9BURK|nr:MAG: 2-keto-4-pentenoate hydratase [Herbaspirillum frisingense]